jgi:hypothetical protein
MSGNVGNLGAANLLGNKNDAVEAQYERLEGWMKHAKGLLMILVLGLMLACGTTYASEPTSPAPVTITKNKANHIDPTYENAMRRPRVIVDSSPALGDSFFDWSIGIFLVIMAALFSIGFLDSKEKDSD